MGRLGDLLFGVPVLSPHPWERAQVNDKETEIVERLQRVREQAEAALWRIRD